MILLLGLVSGVITGLSPCVLPILPVVLTSSAGAESRHARARPFLVIGGLVAPGSRQLAGWLAGRWAGGSVRLLRFAAEPGVRSASSDPLRRGQGEPIAVRGAAARQAERLRTNPADPSLRTTRSGARAGRRRYGC